MTIGTDTRNPPRDSYTLYNLVLATGVSNYDLRRLERDGIFTAPRDAYGVRRWTSRREFDAARDAVVAYLRNGSGT